MATSKSTQMPENDAPSKGPGPTKPRKAAQVFLPNKKRKAILFLVLFFIQAVVISAVYIGFAAHRSNSLYDYVKSNQPGWKGKIHQSDRELGFAPIPDSGGEHVFPVGPNIPIRYDENGFRIPVEKGDAFHEPHPLLLMLGCSFTYGYATPAKDAWPYLTGRRLNGSTKNAGVPSYGLCQMLILARRLIPVYQPDFVVVQYSPWLVSRSISLFAPAYFGKLPAPYFYQSNHLAIHPPVFQTKITDLPVDRYYTSPKGTSDYLSFLWHVGLPLFVHDDFNMILYRLKRAFSFLPEPDANQDEVVRYVYEEIAKVAEENQTKVVIVILGRNHVEVQIPEHLFQHAVIIVNAHRALIGRLNVVNNTSYLREYAHWRGSPPSIVDIHPNKKAHRIIAEEIVLKIREQGFGNQRFLKE